MASDSQEKEPYFLRSRSLPSVKGPASKGSIPRTPPTVRPLKNTPLIDPEYSHPPCSFDVEFEGEGDEE